MTCIAVLAPHALKKTQQQLLYLAYGDNEVYRREVKFSILTALNQLKSHESLCIRIMTDRPQDYAGWPVDTVVLTDEILQQWQGQNGYHHRRKACALATGLELAEKTLFADTDTLFLKSPYLLLQKVRPQHYLMDRFEYHWREVSARQSYLKLGERLQPHGIKHDSDFKLYNSGLCGLTDSDKPLLETSIGYIDEWTRESFDIHTIEQIALSFAMRESSVQEARGYVYHYFAEKHFFHPMLAHFFSKYGEDYRPELIKKCEEMPRSKPQPLLWQRLCVKWRLRKLKGQLKKIGRDLLYGSELPDTPYFFSSRQEWWKCACREITRMTEQERNQLLNLSDRTWPEALPKPRKAQDQQVILDYLHRQLTPQAN